MGFFGQCLLFIQENIIIACKMVPLPNTVFFFADHLLDRQQRGYFVCYAREQTSSELLDGLADGSSYLTFKALGGEFSVHLPWSVQHEYDPTYLFLLQLVTLMAGGHAMPGMKRYFKEKGKKKEQVNTHPGFIPSPFSHIETQILLFWIIISS